jgi:hypothetical protein
MNDKIGDMEGNLRVVSFEPEPCLHVVEPTVPWGAQICFICNLELRAAVSYEEWCESATPQQFSFWSGITGR